MPATPLFARNDVLNVNPSSGTTISLVAHGSDWYWTVFSIMSVTAICYAGTSFKVPRRERFFHYTSIVAAIFAAITYFSLASNLGWTGVQTRYNHYQGGGVRQVFYARYIGWFLSAPLLVLNLSFFSGLNWVTALYLATLTEVYVVCGLIASLVESSYKFGYFTMGAFAWVLLFLNLGWVGLRSIKTLNAATVTPKLSKIYSYILMGVGIIYSLYPISWGLSEGGNVISPTSEGIFYGILDIMALPVLNSLLLFYSRKLDIDELGLSIPSATRTPGKN
ncbi:hypothetical protein BZA70DRAFT_104477 [Myxozyma melibiosi]|uniref:Family A G protein-coupled receptor-like protein n=1 Tax=Myxozyma melibiosi TaxID=54550 RepID=A0ABR1EZY9_9ASCO